VNERSAAVMQKLGMEKVAEFKHSKLADYPFLEKCAFCRISKNNNNNKP